MLNTTQNDQLAINAQVSRAKAERDQRAFVRQVFDELAAIRAENAELKSMLAEVLAAKKTKKEEAKAE